MVITLRNWVSGFGVCMYVAEDKILYWLYLNKKEILSILTFIVITLRNWVNGFSVYVWLRIKSFTESRGTFDLHKSSENVCVSVGNQVRNLNRGLALISIFSGFKLDKHLVLLIVSDEVFFKEYFRKQW